MNSRKTKHKLPKSQQNKGERYSYIRVLDKFFKESNGKSGERTARKHRFSESMERRVGPFSPLET